MSLFLSPIADVAIGTWNPDLEDKTLVSGSRSKSEHPSTVGRMNNQFPGSKGVALVKPKNAVANCSATG
jgi:hypothetical protein